ncbi:glycosyltransferase [Massilia sp. H-1]|nr:glycosyltransferase [Massilia sp. H-1]
MCVGRLCEQKGQLLLVNAVDRLVRKGTPVELVLAKRRRDASRDRGADRTLRPAAACAHHRLDRQRDRACRNRGRAQLVLPSFAEGLPVVIMEAMALRRPVLSTYVA